MSVDENRNDLPDLWAELFALRNRQRAVLKGAAQVVRRRSLAQQRSAQGLLRWYLHPAVKDKVLSTLVVYEQELPPGGRSGRVRFQGGQIIFIIEGEGYTVLDGEKHHWAAGDVLNLPVKFDGIVVQHHNASKERSARFLAVEPNLTDALGVDRGSGFEQIEVAP